MTHCQCDARPTVTFPAAERHRPLAGTKFYWLVTEAHGCEQLAQSCYTVADRPGVELATFRSRANTLTTEPPSHLIFQCWVVNYVHLVNDEMRYLIPSMHCCSAGDSLSHFGYCVLFIQSMIMQSVLYVVSMMLNSLISYYIDRMLKPASDDR